MHRVAPIFFTSTKLIFAEYASLYDHESIHQTKNGNHWQNINKTCQTSQKNPISTSIFSPWVLTRLHTRYSAETLSEDLIFVPARPVRGGRGTNGTNYELPGAVEISQVNQFQGRYIIRHYWQGKVECDKPYYGNWGDPIGSDSQTEPSVPSRLSRTQKSSSSLNTVVRSAIPRLKITGKAPPKR